MGALQFELTCAEPRPASFQLLSKRSSMANRVNTKAKSKAWGIYFPKTPRTQILKWKRTMREFVQSGKATMTVPDVSNSRIDLVWERPIRHIFNTHRQFAALMETAIENQGLPLISMWRPTLSWWRKIVTTSGRTVKTHGLS